VDAWTSPNRIAFLAVVASFITDNWTFHEVLLDFKEMNGAHSGANMAENVFGTLEEFDLCKKVIRPHCIV
jgi:hypothetical protein